MQRANVFTADYEYDSGDPDGYRSAVARVGELAGGSDQNVKAFELPHGQSLCPYHYEYEEEWLLVLQGTVVVRTPDGEVPCAVGDLVCFPAGPDGAHKVFNREPEVARVLMWSSAREPAVAVYPDSGKVGVWTPNESDRFMLRRADADVSYWDGES